MQPDNTRRAFLRTLALGAVYAAPVVYSLTLPKRAMASHKPTHCPKGICPSNSVASPSTTTTTQPPNTQKAPWEQPPPGSRPAATPAPSGGRSRPNRW